MADRSYRRAPADRPPNPRPDRGEPHEWETERALLGGILTAPELLGNLADLPAEVFHRPAHAHLWALVVELHRSGARPDQLVATAEIERRGEADKCGSLPYVDSLPQACPSIEAVPGYARRLREIAAARALRREAQATVERVNAGDYGALAPDLARYGLDTGGGADLGWISPGLDWLSEEPPPREYLVHGPRTDYDRRNGTVPLAGLLPRGTVALLAAAGGTGKTYALTGLSLALVTGLDWFGAPGLPGLPVAPRLSGRVALILGEETPDEVRRRIHVQARAMGADAGRYGRTIADRLVALPGAGRSVALVEVDPASRAVRPTATAADLRGWLRREAERTGRGWDAVIFDPLARLSLADTEKDNGAATRLIETLETFAALPGRPAVIAAHHTRKPSGSGKAEDETTRPTSAADVRGASGLVDGARWVAGMHAGREIPGGGRLVTFDVTKTNYGGRIGGEGLILAIDGRGIRMADRVERAAAEKSEPASPKGGPKGGPKGAGDDYT